MIVDQRQMQAVLALPGDRRFLHFVKVVADRQEAWGLYQDGWALAATDDGVPVFPLWPAREYAEACAVGAWVDYSPRGIKLDDITTQLLPRLNEDGVLPGIFMTTKDKAVTPTIGELLESIEAELKKY